MSTAEIELLEQQQHRYTTVDVTPVSGAPPRVEGEGSSEPAGDAPQVAAGDGGSEHSVGTQDLQTTSMVIDIGDNKTIEITLRGNLTLQTIGPQATAGGGSAAATPSPRQGTVLSPQASEDQQFLDQMRGWLTTVATLFIGIAFQAAMQPPSWIPQGWYKAGLKKSPSGAPTTMPAPSPSPTAAAAATSTITSGQATKASLYVIFNTMTFAVSLAMVVVLLLMKKSTPTEIVRTVAVMVASLCISVGITFAVGNSYGPGVSWGVIFLLVWFSCGLLFFWFMPCSRIMKLMIKLTGRSRANGLDSPHPLT